MFAVLNILQDGFLTIPSCNDFLDTEDANSAGCHTQDGCGDAARNRSAVVYNAFRKMTSMILSALAVLLINALT